MPSFSFLYLLHWPIHHQPFTMKNALNTWARSLDVIYKQALCFPSRDKNCLHISEMLQSQQVKKCTNVQSTSPFTIHWNFPNIGQMRQRWMSPTFAHSSKSVYLFPISHSNKFHNCFNDNVNLHCIAQIGSQCAWLGYKNGGSRHCDWLICHCAGLVSWRIMILAHIVAECMICTIDDIATMVGSMSFCKDHAQHTDYCIHPCCKLASCSHVWCTVLLLEQHLSTKHGYIHAAHHV